MIDISIGRTDLVSRIRSNTDANRTNIYHRNDHLLEDSTSNQPFRRQQDGKVSETTSSRSQLHPSERMKRGIHKYSNGNTYMGEWLNKKKDGEGVFTWPNGDRYEIEYSEMTFNYLFLRYWTIQNAEAKLLN